MSSFTSHLHQISSASADGETGASRPHLGPTPVDSAALFRLVQDQMATLASSAPSEENRSFLLSLIETLSADVDAPPSRVKGVTHDFLDALERVPKKQLRPDDSCPICAEPFLDDEYPLIVELPCHESHRFMLECVRPWLQSKGTCPMCRKDLTEKKAVEVPVDYEEDDDPNGMYY